MRLVGHTRFPLWRLFLKSGGWFVLVAFLFVFMLTFFSAASLQLAKRFEAEGLSTTGFVADKYERIETDSDGDRTTVYYLEITFDTRREQPVTVTRSVGFSKYNASEKGAPIPVLYLESQPSEIELEPGENRSASVATRYIALVFGLLGLGGLWFAGRRSVAGARARAYGQMYRAKVIRHHRTAISVNKKRLYRLVWSNPDGTEYQSLGYPANLLRAFKPGAEITVYTGIKRDWWEGDVGPRNSG